MPKKISKLLSFSLFAGLFFGLTGYSIKTSYSANLTNVSSTISNSRLSFRGALGSGNAAASSIISIDVDAGDYPSTSSAQLVEGDVLRIGEDGSLGSYTVASTSSLSTLSLKTVLAAGDADTADDVISTQSATHTVRFTSVSAINNGRFRILVPAHSDDGTSSDGIPDGSYFDFGTSAPTVTCPTDITNYDFVTGTATASTITMNSSDYHSFECAYSGSGAIGSDFDGTTNDYFLVDSLINPAPATGHTTGTADTYSVIVQHLDASFDVIDQTTVKIGVIEAVKITAEVAPQITFRIIGQNSGTAACGFAGGTDVSTTATSVPFGGLLISDFTTATQGLTVSTNAQNGYAVTAIANDQLGINGAACSNDTASSTCIPDASGDTGATMTQTNENEWSDTAQKGFAYSVHDINTSGSTPAFSYNGSVNDCDGTGDCFRQFADDERSDVPETPVTIFSHTDVADNQNINVCYKSIISSTQAAGFYESYITYTATATF